jgi:hypothetical protein
LFLSAPWSPEYFEACVHAGLPIILLGSIVGPQGVDNVLADNTNGARQAVKLLLRTGCRWLAYLGLGGATFSDKERFQGFSNVVKEADLSFSFHSVEGSSADAAFNTAISMLSASRWPDGVFCGSDSIAFCVIEAARALGLAVPGDLSVVGFNNVLPANWRSFKLTTIEYPIGQTIDNIVELLDKNGFVQSVVDAGSHRFLLLDTHTLGQGWGSLDGNRLEWLNQALPNFADDRFLDAPNLSPPYGLAVVNGRNVMIHRIEFGHSDEIVASD